MSFHEFAFVEGTFINVKGSLPFADDKFAAMCSLLEENLEACTGMLGHARGSRLTAEQRKTLGALFVRGGFPVAVITEAPETRGSVTALTWDQDIKIRSFSNVDDAVAFLGSVSAAARATFDDLVRKARDASHGG